MKTLRNMIQHWRTSLGGVLCIGVSLYFFKAAWGIHGEWHFLYNVFGTGHLVSGIGHLLAADAK